MFPPLSTRKTRVLPGYPPRAAHQQRALCADPRRLCLAERDTFRDGSTFTMLQGRARGFITKALTPAKPRETSEPWGRLLQSKTNAVC